MSITRLRSRMSVGKLFIAGLAIVTGLVTAAEAQTAPQLLPYTAKAIAGGGPSATFTVGATCPVAGAPNVALDAFGDGCLATEIQLVSARYAIADAAGNVFFSDYTNGLIRRVDATTGIVTAIAGQAASSPAAGTACGVNLSLDAKGDGCAASLVKLSHPTGLVFSPAGDLYLADFGYGNVRKLAAVGGVVTGNSVISMVDGQASGTFGYASNFGSTLVIAATGGYLDGPVGLAFDPAGNLYIAEEFKNALLVVNTNATTTTTVAGITIPPGTVAKIAGSPTGGGTVCPNSPASPFGCNFGTFVPGASANASQVDSPYGLAVDPAGNVYFANEFLDDIGIISPAGIINNYAGILNSAAKNPKRGPAGSFGVGSPFGVAADSNSNIYFTDASSGLVWRVDGAGKSMYVVGGGATTVCAAATDAFGDGCPATQAKFGSSGAGNFASTTAPGPGVYGVSVDPYSNLYLGDTETFLIRKIASGTQFGIVGANQPTNLVDIHFPAGDSAAGTGAYSLTSGAANFALGTATCTTNTDATTDCLLPLTATPSVLGPFTGTLKVTSALGATGSFPLTGIYVQSPVTRTALTYLAAATCTGTTTYSTTTAVTLTAQLAANGPAAPTGSVSFFANGTQIGSAQPIVNLGTTASPIYGSTLTTTFGTVGTYTLTATYSGDSYFKPSTGKAGTTISTSNPSFATALVASSLPIVSAGQTALYSFNVAQNVYTGTIGFACSGLPANSSCSFSPASIVAAGCSATNLVALSILTQTAVSAGSFGGPIDGRWSVVMTLTGLSLALLIGINRKRVAIRYGGLWMMLALLLAASGATGCGSGGTFGVSTPAGTYTVTVTATGSTGASTTFTVPLTVH